MKRELRDELNKMSQEVFGSSSKWSKLVNKGIYEPMTRERQAVVPKGNSFELKTFVDKKNVLRRYTVDEVTELMKSILEARKPVEAPKI